MLPVQSGNGHVEVDLGGLTLRTGTPYRLHVFSDRTPTIYDVAFGFGATPDKAESNDTIQTAFRLEAIQQIARVSGLRLQSPTDQDWFAFTLPDEDPGDETSGARLRADVTNQLLSLPYHEAKERVLESFEKTYLLEHLKAANGVVTRAAQRSGLPRQSVHRMLRRLGVSTSEEP